MICETSGVSTFTANARVDQNGSIVVYRDDGSIILCDETNPLSYIEAKDSITLEEAR